MIYAINYDLNLYGQNYDVLIERIKKFEGWCYVMKSSWLVFHRGTAQDVYDFLAPALDYNDRILVSELNANHQGWLETNVWDWINTCLAIA